jgi:predicted amidophosphoribosyltransferase
MAPHDSELPPPEPIPAAVEATAPSPGPGAARDPSPAAAESAGASPPPDAVPSASVPRAAERFADLLLRARDELLAALVPPACLACRAPLARAGEQLCVDCRRALPWLPPRRCARCGLPAPCGAPCPAAGAAYDAAWAPLAYDGPARQLVAALKFRRALPAAELIAAQLAALVPRELLDGAALVPVPLHPTRRRQRGFDQAARIAAALARRRGVELARCLRREGVATRQLGASRAARVAPGRLAIAVVGPVPRRAALVDDVHTTGATFNACARALRAHGCREVVAIAYARALAR